MYESHINVPKEFLDEWIAALRSGNYRQGRGALVNYDASINNGETNEYCCMGVALELLREKLRGEWLRYDGGWRKGFQFRDGDGDDSVWNIRPTNLPCLFAYDPTSGYNTESGKSTFEKVLADLNDDKMKTFPEIADFIEEHKNVLVPYNEVPPIPGTLPVQQHQDKQP